MTLRHGFGTRLGALALLLPALAVLATVDPAVAAPAQPDVDVSITHLTPATLPTAGNLTIAGEVHNRDDHAWRNVTVHVLVPHDPFVDHSQARAAILANGDYTGSRVTGLNAVEEFGTLRAGSSESFSITVRRSQLGIDGEDGVYPFSVQVVADNTEGQEARTTIGRATTFLPARAESSTPTRTVVLWPFLLDGARRSDGSYANEAGLLKAIGPHGRLRNLLTLVRTTPKLGSDAMIDPALFAVLEDIADRETKTDADRSRKKLAESFLNDLSRLAEGYSCASVGFDRPDWLAVARSPAEHGLSEVINRATRGTLHARDLECTRLEWPSERGASRPLLSDLHKAGAEAVVLNTWALPNWQSTTGSLLSVQTPSGSLPVIVNDPLDAGLPGQPTVVGLRQIILSEAVFGSIATDSTKEKHPSIVIVNPRLDPGTISGKPLESALGTEVVARKNLAATLRTEPARYDGSIPAKSGVVPVARRQMAEAADADRSANLLRPMLVDESARVAHDQLIASLASERWRGHATAGLRAARSASRDLNRELAAISVEGPRALTLSSRSGRFPITIRNHSPHTMRVGVHIGSSAAGVTFKAPTSVRVAAGESRTSTVDMNMDGQTATTVSVRLTSGDDGASFGASTVFNVRSSRVGAALWIAIGISVAFVAIALIRRFARPGHEPPHQTLAPTDFHD
jgi:hypothetical protein